MSDDLSAKGECIGGNNDERASSTNNQTSSDDYSKFSYSMQLQGLQQLLKLQMNPFSCEIHKIFLAFK